MRAGPKPEITAAPLDLRRLPARGGARAVAFIERYVNVPKGTGARKRLKLRLWQQEIVFGLFDDPRPRQALVSIPRGNGKSTLAAALGVYGLLGDGVEGAQVLCVASDERQAGIVMRAARRMVEIEPLLAARVQVFQDRLYVPATDSTLGVLPADPAALHGWDPSLAVVDELHVVTRACWEAIASVAGKRRSSLTLAISTPATSTESVMWDLVELGRAGDDPGFYYVEFAAPTGCQVDDEEAWAEANPALGDFLYADGLRASLRTTGEASFRRLRLGQWVQDDDAWLPAGAWAACAAPGHIPDGEKVVLGVDGSFSSDPTAVVAASLGERPHVDLVAMWEAPEGARDWRVPILDVEAAIREACRRWQVREVAFDPFRWGRTMQVLEAEGLPVVEFPQSPARMVAATTRFYEAVVNGQLTHSGDPRLARHIANCVLKADARGARVTKQHKDSKRRVDAAVAAIMAFDRAAVAEPAMSWGLL